MKCPECGCTDIWDLDCPGCNGSGEDDHGEECGECEGDGFVYREQECSKCGHTGMTDEFEDDGE